MNLAAYNAFCGALPQADHALQWGGMAVWKVGGKLFAMARESDGILQVTFKATEIGYEIMRDMDGLRPAPYLASRGMKWIQQYQDNGLDDAALKEHIKISYDMAVQRLTRKDRAKLNL